MATTNIDKVLKDFDDKFVREDGLMDKYFQVYNEESEMGYDTISTAEAIKSFLSEALTTQHRETLELVENSLEAMKLQFDPETKDTMLIDPTAVEGWNYAIIKALANLKTHNGE